MSENNPYRILKVSRDAGALAVKQAYLQRVQEVHPDLHPDDVDATERFKEVQAAYELLRDPQLRAVYDRRHPATEDPDVARAIGEREWQDFVVDPATGDRLPQNTGWTEAAPPGSDEPRQPFEED